MKPCLFYAQSSVWRQTLHILQEVYEVVKELVMCDYERAGEELADVQVACETLLYIIGYQSESEREQKMILKRKKKAEKKIVGIILIV